MAALDFDDFGAGNPFHTGTASGTALSGDAAGNRFTMTATIAASVPNTHYLAIRWFDADLLGVADHSLATDDLTVSFTAVPEPGALVFGTLVCGLAGFMHCLNLRRVRACRR